MGTVDLDTDVECTTKNTNSSKNNSFKGEKEMSPKNDDSRALRSNSERLNKTKERSENETAILVNGIGSSHDTDQNPDGTLSNERNSVDNSKGPLFEIKVLDDIIENSEDFNDRKNFKLMNGLVNVEQEHHFELSSMELEAPDSQYTPPGEDDTDDQDAEEALTEFLKLNKTREKRSIRESNAGSNKVSSNKSTATVNEVKIYPSRKSGNNVGKLKFANKEVSNDKGVDNPRKMMSNKLAQMFKHTSLPRNAKIASSEPKLTTKSLLNLLEGDDDDSTISAPVSLVVQVPKLDKSEIDKLCNSRGDPEPSGMRTRKRKLKFSSDGKLIKRDKTRNLDKKYRSAGAKILYSSDSEDEITPSESSESEVDEPEKLKTKPKMGTPKAPTPFPSKSNAKIVKQVLPNNKNNMQISSPSKKSVNPTQILSTVAGGLKFTSNHIRVVKFKPKIMEVKTPRSGIPVAKDMAQSKIPKHPISPISTPSTTNEKISSTFAKLPSGPQANKVHKSTPTVSSPGKLGPDSISTRKYALTKCKPFVGPKNSYLQPIFDFEQDYEYEHGSRPEEVTHTTPVVQILHDIHKAMPNWNLHILPDSETYCMSQITRGRMGIPTLLKSIEFDENFSARIFVHQLHVKRFDGVYDTQDLLIKLIKEIDSLAA